MGNALALLTAQNRAMLAVTDVVLSASQDLGSIVPAGRTVAVTAISIKTSVANEFRLQSGGFVSPTNDKWVFDTLGSGTIDRSFKHPLIFDGLAAEWANPGGLRVNIAYKILD